MTPQIEAIDHIVITAAHPEETLAFYTALGFTAREAGGRYELFAGDFKINVHVAGRELLPHARRVQPGSADFCLRVSGQPAAWEARLREHGIPVELGVVAREGALGAMQSIYLRDPDGNLVELCFYGAQ